MKNIDSDTQKLIKGSIIALVIIVIAIYYIKPIKSRLLLLTFFISTLIITWIIKLRNTGSLWCFVTAILAPILVILNYYIIKGEKDVIV